MNDHDAFGYWLSGFWDGEGHFSIKVYLPGEYNQYFYCVLGARLNLRADEQPIVEQIRDYWRCGAIRYNKAFGRTKRQVRYDVRDFTSLATIVVPFFHAYPLRAKKRRDFEVWSEAVELAYLVHNRVLTPTSKKRGRSRWAEPDMLRLREIEQALSQTRAYKET